MYLDLTNRQERLLEPYVMSVLEFKPCHPLPRKREIAEWLLATYPQLHLSKSAANLLADKTLRAISESWDYREDAKGYIYVKYQFTGTVPDYLHPASYEFATARRSHYNGDGKLIPYYG